MTPISGDAFDRARRSFAEMSSGQATADDHAFLFSQVLRAIDVINRLDLQSGQWSHDSLDAMMRNDALLTYSLDNFNLFLNSSRDALVTVFAIVAEARVIPTLSLSTLARQAMEASVSAQYVLDTDDLELTRSRGFAAAWENLIRQEQFAAMAREGGFSQEEDLVVMEEKNHRQRNELTDVGRRFGLGEGNEASFKPRNRWPSKTEMLRTVDLHGHVWDLRLLYSMLSGQSHGMSWAQLGGSRVTPVADYVALVDGKPQYAGHSLTIFEPQSRNAAFALKVAMDILDTCISMRTVLNSPPTK